MLTKQYNGISQDETLNAEAEIKTYESFLLANPDAVLETYFEASDAPISFDFKLQMNLTVTGTPE